MPQAHPRQKQRNRIATIAARPNRKRLRKFFLIFWINKIFFILFQELEVSEVGANGDEAHNADASWIWINHVKNESAKKNFKKS